MSAYIVEKQISFEAGHRLMDYEGKCQYLHGHNYIVTLGLIAFRLDKRGMVEDFSLIKEKAKGFIDENLDHGMILSIHDKEWIKILKKNNQKVYVIPKNPTAEALAEFLYHILKPDFENLKYVTVTETPTSTATFKH